jgi:hypothetical protein
VENKFIQYCYFNKKIWTVCTTGSTKREIRGSCRQQNFSKHVAYLNELMIVSCDFYVKLVQVAKTHLSFATAFFQYF